MTADIAFLIFLLVFSVAVIWYSNALDRIEKNLRSQNLQLARLILRVEELEEGPSDD